MSDKRLIDFAPEVWQRVLLQLEMDQKRWGDTWKHRPIGDYQDTGDQVERTRARFRDYFDQYEYAGIPVPWEKIIGNAIICMVRELHPEELELEEGEDE